MKYTFWAIRNYVIQIHYYTFLTYNNSNVVLLSSHRYTVYNTNLKKEILNACRCWPHLWKDTTKQIYKDAYCIFCEPRSTGSFLKLNCVAHNTFKEPTVPIMPTKLDFQMRCIGIAFN